MYTDNLKTEQTLVFSTMEGNISSQNTKNLQVSGLEDANVNG